MNSNKYALGLTRLFNLAFAAAFGLLLLCILVKGYENESSKYTYCCDMLQHIIIILSSVAIIFIISVLYYRFCRKSTLKSEVNPEIIFRFVLVGVLLLMFIIQLYVSTQLLSKTQDLSVIDKFARDFGVKGDFSLVGEALRSGRNAYIIKYPNNYAILFFLSALYRINFLLTGEISDYLPVFVNIIAINFSVFMTVMLVKRLYGRRKALFALGLCAVFAPYYTLTPYYYTDTLSMPLLISSTYLFMYAIERGSKPQKYILMFLCGILIFEGFKMKGSIILLFAVCLIYLFIKFGLKKAACLALALCIGFGCAGLGFKAAVSAAELATSQEAYENEYPYTHWVMMGLKGDGGFSKKDSSFTKSFKNKDEKQKANIAKINAQLKKLGLKGLVRHLGRKAVWTWEDGTYYSARLLEKYKSRSFLHDIVLNDGEHHFEFYSVCCGFQLFLIFSMLLSSVKAFKYPEIQGTTFLRGSMLAIFIFLLIWETRSRYILNFTPFMFVLAIDGLDFISDIIKKKFV